MYIISTLKANIMYTRVYNVRIGPLDVRAAFAACRTEIELIPGGYTSKLQPMDVDINKLFKNHIRNHFYDWLAENRNRKPKRNEVAEWIHGAWSKIQEVTVRNSFRCAGIWVDEVVPVEKREELKNLLLEGPDDGVLILDDSLDVQEPDMTTARNKNAGTLHTLRWEEVGGILNNTYIID